MNVVIYARFSSHSQNEQSIEGQMAVCHEYAEKNGYAIVGEYIDRALTGTSDNRPEFQRMITDSNKRLFDGVLVYQLDRFSRNRYDSAIYKKKLQKNGVRVLSAKENISEDASGILIESVLEGMAEYYSAELAQKIRRGMDLNAQKCVSTGGNIALGFRVDGDKHFQIDDGTAPVVREIFQSYANGKTITEITASLNARGLKTSRGVTFNKNSLRTLLRNKRYIGVYTYKGTEIPDGLPRIIDDDLFNQVQDIMDKNKKAPARARAKEDYLLTTKLFCGYCHEMMTGYGGTSKTGKVHNYYICNTVKKKGDCRKKTVRKKAIEDAVVAECHRLLTDESIALFIDGCMKQLEEDKKNNGRYTALQKSLKNIERKRTNLLNAICECDIDSVRKALYEQMAVIENEKQQVTQEIAIEESRTISVTPEQMKFFFTMLRKGDPSADDLSNRKRLINMFVDAAYLYDDKITIVFNAGSEPLTINADVLDRIDRSNAECESSFMDGVAPPKEYYTNSVYFVGGFAVTVWRDIR